MNDEALRCPHCGMGTAVEFTVLGDATAFGYAETRYMHFNRDKTGTRYWVDYGHCQYPGCGRLIVRLQEESGGKPCEPSYVLPRTSARARLDGIPPELTGDYEEACAVLDTSPAASAALARRCLQGLIRDYYEIETDNLYEAIKKVAALKMLPPYLVKGLDRVREIGNLAAHPKHDTELAVIVRVSREEAEWTLEILEGLFKHCYVDPGEHERRTKKLREKLDRTRDKGGHRGQPSPGNPAPAPQDPARGGA